MKKLKLTALASVLTLAAGLIHAQDNGALLDLLVKKKVITDQEAENVRSELSKEYASSSAGKLNLSQSITQLKIGGDLRTRYQYDNMQNQVPDTGNNSQRDRFRFRLRLSMDVQFAENFFAGMQLQTSQAADSGNQTFTQGYDNYNVFISKAFMGWSPTDWATVIIGKQANPFYSTDLVWDTDVNPQGFVEKIDIGKALFPDSNFKLALVAGQLIFNDNNEFNLDSDMNTDAWMFVEQLIASYNFNKDMSLTFAPGFTVYTAAATPGLLNQTPFTNEAAIGVTTSQSQTTVTTRNQVQVSYNAAGVPTKVVTPVTTTTAVETTTPTTGSPRTVNTSTDVKRSAQVTTVGAATGLPNNPALAGQQFTTTEAGASRTITTNTTNTLPAVSGDTRGLAILTLPGDFSFKLFDTKMKFYWDFAYNFNGEERMEETYQFNTYPGGTKTTVAGFPQREYSTRDGIAWLVGLQAGEIKKKGDWMAALNYRQTGLAAVDPNLNDGDFAMGYLNTRGFTGKLAYAFTDFMWLQVTGMWAWNLDGDNVGFRATNPPNSTNPIANANAVQVIQVDLNVKF